MVEKLDEILKRSQYEKIDSQEEHLLLYVQFLFSYAQAVQIIDADKATENSCVVDGDSVSLWKDEAKGYVTDQGYDDIRFLTIIVSNRPEHYKEIAAEDPECWIVDGYTSRLFVYENQDLDFDSLRISIEQITNRDYELDSYGTNEYTNRMVRSQAKASLEMSHSWNTADTTSFSISELAGNLTIANAVLIVINVVVHAVLSSKGSTLDVEYMLEKGAMYVPSLLEDHQFYRLFSCMFMHFGFPHLFGNMIVLYLLGGHVERELGMVKYAILYLGGGLFGSVGSFLHALIWKENAVSAGASGAIFAVMGALLWVVVQNKGRLQKMTTAKVVILFIYELYSGFVNPQIDMAAHLFGFIGGFGLAMIMYRQSDVDYI